MGIFGNDKSKAVATKKGTQSTTIITQCMKIKGDIAGCGMIHIDGIIYGDLDIEDTVIIGESGAVYGNIKAKKVLVSGIFEGSIVCQALEVTSNGKVSDKVHANTVISDGTLHATVLASTALHITKSGKVKTEKLESKRIVVNGYIEGRVVASELLEIGQSGTVKGDMIVRKIKVTEGGLMLGTMLTYTEADATIIDTKVATEVKKINEVKKIEEVKQETDKTTTDTKDTNVKK